MWNTEDDVHVFHRDIRLVCCLSISVVYQGLLCSVNWYAWCLSTQWTSIVSDHRRYNCDSKQQNKTTRHCTPVDAHLDYLLMYTRRCTPGLHLEVHLDYPTCWCTPVDTHLDYLLMYSYMYTRRCTPGLHLDVHLDYLLMDSCWCTPGLLVDVQLSGYLSTHIYETVCSCTCMRPPVNSHPQDTTPVAQRLQCESKKLHSFTFVITLSNKALSWQFLAHL